MFYKSIVHFVLKYNFQKEIDMHLERIKNMREDLDMTQKDLAKILNISQRTLSHYELGTRDIPTQTLIALADFYHCSTDYLLGRTNKKEVNK